MDKNKSAYKLNGLPKVYWINLDSDVRRRRYMEDQFSYWEIDNHIRVSAYDGRGGNIQQFLFGRYPDNVTASEIGCCMSHLKAIKDFYDNTDDEYCMIVEDDVNFGLAGFWSFSWNDIIDNLPLYWDCIQLTTICTGDIHTRLHLKFINDFSAAVYLITRHHAEKIIKAHIHGDKFKLDNGVKPRAVSEDLVFESGRTFTFPVFLYNIDFRSNIHQDHINTFHRGSHDALLGFWKKHGPHINIKEYMDYNPYLFRVSESSNQPA